MKKTLIPGMFSSVSEAELITQMLDYSDELEEKELSNKELEHPIFNEKL